MTDQRRFADQPRPDAAQLAYARDQWGSRHQPSSLIHPDIRDGMHSMARFGNAARGVPVVIVRYIAAICRCTGVPASRKKATSPSRSSRTSPTWDDAPG